MFLLANMFSVGATAAVSCGAITMALAPWATSDWTFAASLVMSLADSVGVNAETPMLVMSLLMYLAYEFQKSESERGKSMPTLPEALPLLVVELLLSRLQPAAVSASSTTPVTNTAVLRGFIAPRLSCRGAGQGVRGTDPQTVHAAVDCEHGPGS